MNWLEIINDIYINDDLTPIERYYLWAQTAAAIFSEYKGDKTEIYRELFLLYKKICSEFDCKIGIETGIISNRNNNLVVIITTQFLQPLHAPTDVTLNLAKYLVSCGKQVLIVNSAEFLGGGNSTVFDKQFKFPLSLIKIGSYIPEYCLLEQYNYDGTLFPFFQFENTMPNFQDIRVFVSTIMGLKPGYIVNIGGMSPLADVCSKLIPTLCYSTGNDICFSQAHVQYIGREVQAEDKIYLDIISRDIDSVIPGNYIYSLPVSKTIESRSKFGINDDSFLLAVVGNRLMSELDDKFLTMLNNICSRNIEILFVGELDNYYDITKKYSKLADYSYAIGFATDITAVLAMCDLFVNPIRRGGGTTSVIAMSQGCPVLTTNYGDIATAVGADFIVNDIIDYPSEIIKYVNNQEYYSYKSAKAVERASQLTDTQKMYDAMFLRFEKMVKNL